MGFEIAGQIRLAQMVDNFWNRRDQKKLEQKLEEINEILEDDYHFGYLVKNDRVGYLRALSKTKDVFRGLLKNDPYEGMLVYKGGKYEAEINPDFMRTLEDFYYGEIRKEANIVDLKLHRYNTLRDEKLAICRENPNVHTEEYAQNNFSISREEMFERVKRNEFLFALSKSEGVWYILPKERYLQGFKAGKAYEHYPIELCA